MEIRFCSIYSANSHRRDKMEKIKVMNLIYHMGDGGAQQIIINYLRFFQNDPDIDFRLCVFTGPTNSKYDREIREKNYNVVYLNEPNTKCPIPYIRRFFRQAVTVKAWEAAINDFQPDIVHVHISALLEQTLPAIVRTNVPVRFDTLHTSPYRYKGKERRIIMDAFLNQHVVPVCLTEEQLQTAKEWYKIQDYELVRNGLDIEGLRQACLPKGEAKAYFGLDPDAFVVAGVGRLTYVKNFPFLIEAFAQLHRIHPDSKLVFAGEGSEKDNLLRLVQEKNLSDHVVFLGNVTDVSKLYSAADVVAVPSFSEALPLVVLEAQMCGVRCVLSDGVPSESILLENTRKMPASATAEDWAKALLDTEYSGSAVLPMELYDVRQVNQQMKEIYQNRYHQAMKKRSEQHS